MRTNESSASASSNRIGRGRNRRDRAQGQNVHLIQVTNRGTGSNPPAILQRLLGQISPDIFHLTGNHAARVVIPEGGGFRVLTAGPSELFDEQVDLDFPNVPTGLDRWTEECRALDGESVHFAVHLTKKRLVPLLEEFLEKEVEERKEKKKKEQDEKRKKEEETKESNSKKVKRADETTEQPGDSATPVPQEMPPPAGQAQSTLPESTSVSELASSIVQQAIESSTARAAHGERSIAAQLNPIEMEFQHGFRAPRRPAAAATLASAHSSGQRAESAVTTPEVAANVTFNLTGTESGIADLSSVGERVAALHAAASQVEDVAGPSSDAPPANRVTVDGIELPEDVDPEFLNALPESIRREVLEDVMRLQRIRSATQQLSQVPGRPENNGLDVNPDFMAALPINIQEEIIAQQHAEQQRMTPMATQSPPTSDPAAVINSLPPSMRRQVLADMEDTYVAALPSELATEARELRRELEARHARLLTSGGAGGGNVLSGISAGRALLSLLHTNLSRTSTPLLRHRAGLPESLRSRTNTFTVSAGPMKHRGKQLLDVDGLTCLLMLLFIDEGKIQMGRLHRVLRNLAYHEPTRQWIISALIAVFERAGTRSKSAAEETTPVASTPTTPRPILKGKRASGRGSEHYHETLPSLGNLHISKEGDEQPQTSWHTISIDGALGSRDRVFNLEPTTDVTKTLSDRLIINVHAAPVVCRHIIDTLLALAKAFPVQFLPCDPSGKKEAKDKKEEKASPTKKLSREDSGKLHGSSPSDFWSVLLRLDSMAISGSAVVKKDKGSKTGSKNASSLNPIPSPTEALELPDVTASFDRSPLGLLMLMLSRPAVGDSTSLTDRLLRLLSQISSGVADKTRPAPSVPSRWDAPSQAGSSAELLERSATPKPLEKAAELLQAAEGAAVLNRQVGLVVKVLTSKSCSEEGLEDATNLLLRLARVNSSTREAILQLLLEGGCFLGVCVQQQIAQLSRELKEHSEKQKKSENEPEEDAATAAARGILVDRFSSHATIIRPPKKAKSGSELQLPSMTALTNKAASQNFFLRLLKVVIQLRDASRQESKKEEKSDETAIIRQSTDAVQQMDVEQASSSSQPASEDEASKLPRLSEQLQLEDLWDTLSDCLKELGDMKDPHAVLVLQPTVEAFFLVHAAERSKKDDKKKERSEENQLSHLDAGALLSPLHLKTNVESNVVVLNPNLPPDTKKFLTFAMQHRVVLNQILRQCGSQQPLADGPFAVLVDHTHVLDFDVKRRYFRSELDKMLGFRGREEPVGVHVRRTFVLEDSYRDLHRRASDEWRRRFYIVFDGEEGQDAGGLLREWYVILSKEIFNPNYALFKLSPGDRVTYTPNPLSYHANLTEHLSYFKFVGRFIAKAILDNKLLECYFTRAFYKHILGVPVRYTDMESEDYAFYQSLVYLLEHDVKELGYDLFFNISIEELGKTENRDLKPNGSHIRATNENKFEYVQLVCQEKMVGSIRTQLNSFLEGFYEIIPKHLISIFNEQELELLISGMPTIDLEDLKANTEYHKYQPNSLQIQWFWRALKSFDQEDLAKFLQFVTGTSKVPLQGFAFLEGMNGFQKFQIHRDDRSTDRLPTAHTCFNQLDLPAYETYDKLRTMLLTAIRECNVGFGFA